MQIVGRTKLGNLRTNRRTKKCTGVGALRVLHEQIRANRPPRPLLCAARGETDGEKRSAPIRRVNGARNKASDIISSSDLFDPARVSPSSVRSPASFTLRCPFRSLAPLSLVVSPLPPYSSQPQRMHNMLCALSVRERGNGKRRWHDSIERGGARGAGGVRGLE